MAAAKLDESPIHGPIVALCRALADQVDQAGAAGPSARLAGAYLSALKDLGRATAGVRVPAPKSELDEFRERAERLRREQKTS